MSSEFAVLDLETGLLLDGEPSSDLIAADGAARPTAPAAARVDGRPHRLHTLIRQ